MSEDLVSATVNYWANRVGPRVVFDHDDARQEARIAVWQSQQTGRGANVYKRIIDAMRRLIPGFKQGRQLFVTNDSAQVEPVEYLTPDLILQAKRRIDRIERLPEPEKSIVYEVMGGMTVKEVSIRHKLNESTVSLMLKDACKFIESGG